MAGKVHSQLKLFSNAYLERSSTSRHEYASIIKENDGTLSFKLNFQVRLK